MTEVSKAELSLRKARLVAKRHNEDRGEQYNTQSTKKIYFESGAVQRLNTFGGNSNTRMNVKALNTSVQSLNTLIRWQPENKSEC